jgi:phenylpropionate dioxygenase-like ring-hydroxylating dioxygenase large terminal subunit
MGIVAPLAKDSNTQGVSQLPIEWYASAEIYCIEDKRLFVNSPAYVGHACMTPSAGDFYTLNWMNNAKTLVNDGTETTLISNICRHRQAIMLNGHGRTDHIVCPLHRWTYNLEGKLLGAPKFQQNPCLHLNKSALSSWQGLLFQGSHPITEELNRLGCKQDFNFSDYKFHSAHVDHYDFNWKTFIETYLEDYHVGPFHPGLNQFVDCNDLNWEFGQNYCVQIVGYKSFQNENASPIYQKWQKAVSQYQGNKKPKYGAIWFVYYPFLMIEWYPNALIISHLIPNSVDSCSNVIEFYYPEDIALFEHDYIAAQQAAYHETAIEDKEICERMHQGRKALHAQGLDERGPYQHPLESGLEHFHQWYRTQLSQYLPSDIL